MKKNYLIILSLPFILFSCSKKENKPVILPEDEVEYSTGQINKAELAIILERTLYIEEAYMSAVRYSTTNAIKIDRYQDGYYRYRFEMGYYYETIGYSTNNYESSYYSTASQKGQFDPASEYREESLTYTNNYCRVFGVGLFNILPAAYIATRSGLVVTDYEFNPFDILCSKKGDKYLVDFKHYAFGYDSGDENIFVWRLSINKYGGINYMQQGYVENDKTHYLPNEYVEYYNERKEAPQYIKDVFVNCH